MKIKSARIYDNIAEDGSFRILIDRLWPRGVSKERARVDHWARELAPSDELRKWYQHDHEKWDEFRGRYEAELDRSQGKVLELLELIKDKDVLFLFASKETVKNNAAALKLYLEGLVEP